MKEEENYAAGWPGEIEIEIEIEIEERGLVERKGTGRLQETFVIRCLSIR